MTTSPESAKCFHPSNVVRIDWPVRSLDLSTIEYAKDIFGQRFGRIVLTPRNLQAHNRDIRASKLNEVYLSTNEMYINIYIKIETMFVLLFFCSMVC